ncbi:MAG: glycosyltransferase, partial [Pseudomonadota bacterium]
QELGETSLMFLVHPTLEDTFAMVVLEAMSHGLPVVVSSAQYCGISGLLEDEKNALILDKPRDAGALASALSRVLTDTGLRHRLGISAHELASRFQWQQLAAQQNQLYQQADANRAH